MRNYCRNLILIIFLVVTVLFSSKAYAGTWTQAFTDSFNRADTSTGGAGSTSGAGNSWIDSAGSTWNISSNILQGTTADGSGYTSKFLKRPGAEAGQDQRVVVTIPANGNPSGANVGVALRLQSNNDYYLFSIASLVGPNNGIYIYKIIGGSPTNINPGGVVVNGSSAIDAAHSYQVDASVVGVSPATLAITVTDLTTSTQISSYTTTDSAASLQNSTGVPGLSVWSNSGTITNKYSSFTSYTYSTNSISTTPSSVVSGANRTLTVTGVSTSFTGSPFTLSGGTGASIVSQSVTSGTSATVVINPGTAAGTLTLTDTGSGATTSITVSVPSISTSPSSLLVNTTTSVTVTGSNTAFTGSPFTLSGGTGASIVSQTVTDATHATLSINSGSSSGTLTLTDTISGKTASIGISLGALKIGWVGDSITQGGNGGGDQTVSAAVTALQNYGYTVTSSNQGHSGYGTADWLAGSSALNSAESAFTSAGVTTVSIMLGTNDARSPSGVTLSPSALTPAQHFSNMQSLVGDLVSKGYRVILQTPIYTVPNSAFNGVAWPANVNTVYAQYFALDSTLADGVNVFIGDTTSLTSMSGVGELHSDGVHPSSTGGNDLGALWASGIESALIPVTASSINATPSSSSANVTWTTSKLASSLVKYGVTSSYGASTTEADVATKVTSHSVSLSSLTPCTIYHYQTVSNDGHGNQATSTDSTFSTSCIGSASISSSSSQTITTASGGTINFGSTVITVPTLYTAASSSAIFKSNQIDSASFFSSANTPAGVSSVGNYVVDLKAFVDATTTITNFLQPISITLSYNPASLGNVSESSLVIYRYDAGTGWTLLSSCSVNTSAHTVTCQTTHFSDFAIFGQSSTVTSNSTSSSSRSGTFHYGCKDLKADNYEEFAASNSALCKYSGKSLTAFTKGLFTRNLSLKANNSQVKLLQQYLNQNGFTVAVSGPGSVGKETNVFGYATQAALIKFQKANGIKPAVGYFGPVTRKYIDSH